MAQSQQWTYLGIFTLAGIAVFAVLYFLAEAFIPPAKDYREYYAGVFMFAGEQIPVDPGPAPPAGIAYPEGAPQTAGIGEDLLTLQREQPRRVGRIQLTYRGLADGDRFQVNVVIPELDPKRAYPRSVSIEEAKNAFTLSGERFQLLAANDAFLHLKKLP